VKRLCAQLCAFTCCLASGGDLPKDVLQLAQLKRKVVAELARLPNYTCLETIERSRTQRANEQLRYVDTVHVEVAVADNREIYSWPGADQFEDRDITEMVSANAISNGSFAADIRSVLVDNDSIIAWHGEEEKFGRRTLRWDYRIPYNLSGWSVTYGTHTGRVSAIGSFWADAESLDLLRLETNGDDIPPDLPFAAIKNTLDYARVHLGLQDLLLPRSAELVLTMLDGQQSRNRTEFSHCREFAAQTTLRFEAAPESDTAAAAIGISEVSLPVGLRLSLRLAQAVDSDQTRVGDAISAIVDDPAQYKGKTVVPKGAVLRGHIRQFERSSTPREHYIVSLEFTDLDFPGHHARFFGELDAVEPVANLAWSLSTSRTKILDHGYWTGIRSETETYAPIPVPGVSTFFIEGARFRLHEGLRMTWRTMNVVK
jgi:hypothetical protein